MKFLENGTGDVVGADPANSSLMTYPRMPVDVPQLPGEVCCAKQDSSDGTRSLAVSSPLYRCRSPPIGVRSG